MPVDPEAAGSVSDPFTLSWTGDEPMLYALGVGAGQQDPARELQFTTENTQGIRQQVLPTFAVVLAQFRGAPRVRFGDYNRAMVVHSEQSVSLRRPLPDSGSVTTRNQLLGIYDKGSGALVRTETLGWLPGDPEDQPTISTRWSLFIRGEGGFGVLEPQQGRGRPRLGSRTASWPAIPDPTRRCCTASPVITIPCIRTRAMRPGPASPGRSCTECAPMGWSAGACSASWPDLIPHASRR